MWSLRQEEANTTLAMATLKFLLVLLVTGSVRCTVLAPNSTWWPCSALIPLQNLQLQQVIMFMFIYN